MKKFLQTCLQILTVVFPVSVFLPRDKSAKSIILYLIILGCLISGGIIISQNYQQAQQERGTIPELSSLETAINAQLNTLQEASTFLQHYRESCRPDPKVEKILQDYQNQQIDSKAALEKIHQLRQ